MTQSVSELATVPVVVVIGLTVVVSGVVDLAMAVVKEG